MSNAIIRQQGAGSLVADNFWEFRLGAGAYAMGLLTGAAGALLIGRLARGSGAPRPPTPMGWPVNFPWQFSIPTKRRNPSFVVTTFCPLH